MSVKKVLKGLELEPSKSEMIYLRRETADFLEKLKSGILKERADADVFVGGSFAKGTVSKSEEYDIDVFVRFDWREGVKLSDKLERILKKEGIKAERWHGSRDYFKVSRKNGLVFEVIPVLKLKRAMKSDNVTDLSYFHVNYVKRNLFLDKKDGVRAAKQFCKAAKVYGAESYVHGFSGYALECLIIYYGSFEKMLKELVKIKERVVLDPAKKFKRKTDVVFELNESKIAGPIVLVDPTFKERNVLAALSWETFKKFQGQARKFLRNPSKKYFEILPLDLNKMKKRGGEFVHVVLETDKQEGDIAGTKMKKFSRFLERHVRRYFDVVDSEFEYSVGQKADFYLVARKKMEIVRIGPPLKMKKAVQEFRKANRGRTFVKNGYVHSREKINFGLSGFLEKFENDYSKMIGEMGIAKISVNS